MVTLENITTESLLLPRGLRGNAYPIVPPVSTVAVSEEDYFSGIFTTLVSSGKLKVVSKTVPGSTESFDLLNSDSLKGSLKKFSTNWETLPPGSNSSVLKITSGEPGWGSVPVISSPNRILLAASLSGITTKFVSDLELDSPHVDGSFSPSLVFQDISFNAYDSSYFFFSRSGTRVVSSGLLDSVGDRIRIHKFSSLGEYVGDIPTGITYGSLISASNDTCSILAVKTGNTEVKVYTVGESSISQIGSTITLGSSVSRIRLNSEGTKLAIGISGNIYLYSVNYGEGTVTSTGSISITNPIFFDYAYNLDHLIYTSGSNLYYRNSSGVNTFIGALPGTPSILETSRYGDQVAVTFAADPRLRVYSWNGSQYSLRTNSGETFTYTPVYGGWFPNTSIYIARLQYEDIVVDCRGAHNVVYKTTIFRPKYSNVNFLYFNPAATMSATYLMSLVS